MFSTLTRVGIFVSLFFFQSNRLDGDEIFVFYFCTVVITLSLFVKKVREVDMRLLGLFLCSAAITVPFNFHWPMRSVFLNILIGVLAVKVIAERYDFSVKKTGRMLFVFCMANLVFILLQKFNADPIFQKVFEEKAGMMWMPWMLGAGAVLSIPFLTRCHPSFVIFVLPLLLSSRSKSCMVAGVLTFFISSRIRLSFRWTGLAIVAVLSYIYFADFNFDLTRFAVWGKVLTYLRNPVLGNGIGSWAHEGFLKYNGATPEHWRWAHNEFLQAYFEQGALGLLALTVLLIGLWSKDPMKRGMISAMVFISFFHPIFRFGKFLGLIVLIFAWLMPKRELRSPSLEFSNTISPR